MNKRNLGLWVIVWVAVAAATTVATSSLHIAGASLFGFVATFLLSTSAVSGARRWLTMYKASLGDSSSKIPTTLRSKLLIPCGMFSVAAGFTWLILMMRSVPDTDAGALILFGPTFGLIILGIAMITAKVLIWFGNA